MAKLVLENNENVLGKDLVEDAKEKISNNKNQKSQTKEVNANEQEKVKRAGRPRRTAWRRS